MQLKDLQRERWYQKNSTKEDRRKEDTTRRIQRRRSKWIAAVEHERRTGDDNEKWINFALRCAVDHDGPWKCEAEVGLHALDTKGTFGSNWFIQKRVFCFDQNCSDWIEKIGFHWHWFTHPLYLINDKVTLELRIRIISFERIELVANNFAVPNEMSNVVLKIGEKELHVSKEYLAVHSPVFKTLFFGEFVEKGKEEVEIKDVVYEEFLDLLHFIFHDVEITDHTLPHILMLADRFQMERVMNQAKKHLVQSKNLDVATKLIFADQYRLDSLRNHCLQSFTDATVLGKKLKSIPEFANFSDETKVAICNRTVALH